MLVKKKKTKLRGPRFRYYVKYKFIYLKCGQNMVYTYYGDSKMVHRYRNILFQ
jgi:hypothetical protein